MVIAVIIVAVAGMASRHQDAVRSELKGLDYEKRVYPS
jgi:hypothetical protein